MTTSRPTLAELLSSQERSQALSLLTQNSERRIVSAQDWSSLLSMAGGLVLGATIGISTALYLLFDALSLLSLLALALGILFLAAAALPIRSIKQMSAHRSSAQSTLDRLDREAREAAALSAQEHYGVSGLPLSAISLSPDDRVETEVIKDDRPLPVVAFFPSELSPLTLLELTELPALHP